VIRNSWKIGSIVMGLAVLAAGVPAVAGNLVPFKGTDSGMVQVIGQPSLTVVITHDVSSGHGTHVGAYMLEGQESIDLTTLAISNGMATLTAANGDEIFLSYSGQAMPSSTPGFLTSTFTATITGGTGRFGGAIGSLTFSSIGSLATGQFTETVIGEISSPGAAK
jgi:hypothetical protein